MMMILLVRYISYRCKRKIINTIGLQLVKHETKTPISLSDHAMTTTTSSESNYLPSELVFF